MAQNAPNEIEEAIKTLKSRPGFSAYILMNNDGIVIKYENVEYNKAVMYAYHILDLYSKSKKRITQLMDTDNEVECLRLRTKMHEVMIAQYLKFTLVVLQIPESNPAKATDGTGANGEETQLKEGEEKAAG